MGYEREDEDETDQLVLELKSLSHLQLVLIITLYLATTFIRMVESGEME